MFACSVSRVCWPARPAGLNAVASGSLARAIHAPPRPPCSEPLSGTSVTLLARAGAPTSTKASAASAELAATRMRRRRMAAQPKPDATYAATTSRRGAREEHDPSAFAAAARPGPIGLPVRRRRREALERALRLLDARARRLEVLLLVALQARPALRADRDR